MKTPQRMAVWLPGAAAEETNKQYIREIVCFIVRGAKVSKKAAFFFTLAYRTLKVCHFLNIELQTLIKIVASFSDPNKLIL